MTDLTPAVPTAGEAALTPKHVDQTWINHRVACLREMVRRTAQMFAEDEPEYWPDEHIGMCHSEMRFAAATIFALSADRERLRTALKGVFPVRVTCEHCGHHNQFPAASPKEG